MKAVELLDRQIWAGIAPPPRLTVSEFSDREIVVTAGPLAGTRWKTALAPYQAAIMDACLEPGVEFVVVMGSSQWGKTATALNVVAYHIAHDPCPILIVEPTVDPLAREISKNRLGPMIEASPALADRIGAARSRDASNTTLLKTFRGGSVAIGGANSASSLAVRSVRVLVLDEIERYPDELEGEGNTVEIALKRALAFRGRRRVYLISSPKLRNGRIHRWFQRGDQRRFYVPCPDCGHMHTLAWANVKFVDRDPLTAELECPACHVRFGDAERIAALQFGEWRAEGAQTAEPGIVSFHLWEAYSPLSSLSEIVTTFLRAQYDKEGGDHEAMHTWENTTLGEPRELDDGDGVEPTSLLMRREGPETWPPDVDVPLGACCLTAGVDVQDDRLEALVIGWGLGEESWIVDRQTLPGDTSQPEPWRMLDELLEPERYRHALGVPLTIHATCIDSAGHRTTLVYDYAHRMAARRVFATIGRDGDRQITSSPSPRRWGPSERKVPLYTIGVDAAKALIVSRLKLTEKGRGYVHIRHVDWADEELAAQLASERLTPRFHEGVPTLFWKKTRARNEALDCFVLALAALKLLNQPLDVFAARLRSRADEYLAHARAVATSPAPPAAPPAAAPAPRPTGRPVGRSSYLARNARGQGW